MSLAKDVSPAAVAAGFVTVLVGFTSSAALVFQAARAFGATPAQIGSWILALGIGMGVTCILLSLRYRVPVVTAWSTPGAAMLITAAAGVSMNEAIGAFLVCGLLITIAGYSGLFERLLARIPLSIAAAMLAGVLLRFGIDVFTAMNAQLALAGTMLATYLLMRRVRPRYAVIAALAAPQGPSHHQSIEVEPVGAFFGSAVAIGRGLGDSISLYPTVIFFAFAQSSANGVRRAPYGSTSWPLALPL